MYRIIYPIKDVTIRSQYPNQNDGKDQILEISKITNGSPSLDSQDESVYYQSTFNSRILMQFDLTDISSSISSGNINSTAKYYLVIKSIDSIALPISYSIFAYPVSGSWNGGRGYFNNNPKIVDGVSWNFKTSKLTGDLWLTSSYNMSSTGSFLTIPGGGNWFTSSVSSQSFNNESPDIRMEVTSIVRSWVSGSIPNSGFIIKLNDDLEQNSEVFGSLKLFSESSHTIFQPCLQVFWDDSDLSGTGSYNEIGSDNYTLWIKNLKETYSDQEKPRLRIGVRDKFVQQTYATSSNYLISQRLPTGSFYQIQDYKTDDVIVPFNDPGTLVNCDLGGNYIKMDMTSLSSERYYKILFKSSFDGGETIKVNDEQFIFKVGRN